MSTNSMIGLLREDGKVDAIYCHWDGYPEYVGNILFNYYKDVEKIKQLIALGGISSLRERVAPDEGEKHSFDKPLEDVVIAYHRDRGEPLNDDERGTWESEDDYLSGKFRCGFIEYAYLFKDGEWYVSPMEDDGFGKLEKVSDVLASENSAE